MPSSKDSYWDCSKLYFSELRKDLDYETDDNIPSCWAALCLDWLLHKICCRSQDQAGPRILKNNGKLGKNPLIFSHKILLSISCEYSPRGSRGTQSITKRTFIENITRRNFRNSKNKIFQDTLNIEKEFDILFLILSVPTLGSELKDNFSSLSVAGLRSQDCK